MRKKGRGVIIQLAVALPLLTVLLSLGCAELILSEVIGEEKIELLACILTGIVAFAASLYAAIRSPQKKLIWGMLTALGYGCCLLVGNLLFFGIGYGRILPIMSSVLGAGLLGSLLGAAKRRKYA